MAAGCNRYYLWRAADAAVGVPAGLLSCSLMAALLPVRIRLPQRRAAATAKPADAGPKCFLQARARVERQRQAALPLVKSARRRLPAGAWHRQICIASIARASLCTTQNAAAAGAWALPSCSRASGLCGVVLRRRSCKAGSDTASTSAQRAGSCIYSAPKQQQR